SKGLGSLRSERDKGTLIVGEDNVASTHTTENMEARVKEAEHLCQCCGGGCHVVLMAGIKTFVSVVAGCL
ncbi:hypothetical protein Hamer_G015557, partial [Homarus americanus]